MSDERHPRSELLKWQAMITSGRTEFSHCHVAPMISEILHMREQNERLRDHIWEAALAAGFEVEDPDA